jgi:hypothetical protein
MSESLKKFGQLERRPHAPPKNPCGKDRDDNSYYKGTLFRRVTQTQPQEESGDAADERNSSTPNKEPQLLD